MEPPSDYSGGQLSAVDSEEQIIAAALEGGAKWLARAVEILDEPETIVDPDRRLIWIAIRQMVRSGDPVSYETVSDWLKHHRGITDASDLVLMHTGSHTIRDESLANWHVRQVALARMRALDSESRELISTADVTPDELLKSVREMADKLEKLIHSTDDRACAPRPLVAVRTAVLPFDDAWLPSSLRPWVADISERMQCPPDFPAMAAISALSSVAGRRFCIMPKEQDTSWYEFPTLWAMLIGRPSLMKSPSMQAVMRPLRRLQETASRSHDEGRREMSIRREEARIKRAALESKAKAAAKKAEEFDYSLLLDENFTEEPLRRFIVNNTSVEALGEVLMGNPNGVLLYQDELAGLLALLEKDGNEGLRAFLLQAWAGKEGFTFDRIVRGTRQIPHCIITVMGSIQPGVISNYVRSANSESSGDDGFLQRFSLMVWPDAPKVWKNVDRQLDEKAEAAAFDVFEVIENLSTDALVNAGVSVNRDGIPSFHFAPDAQERFREWHTELETQLRSSSLRGALESHLSKYRKLVPAYAVLIHVAEWQTGPVTLSALNRAIDLAKYLESHAHRIYDMASAQRIETAQKLLEKIRSGSGELPTRFTAREVHRKGWSGLSRPDDAEAACELLVDHGWLVAEKNALNDQGGRPTRVFRLSPFAKRE